MKKLALEVRQSSNLRLFVITMNIVEIESICTISRIFRDDDNILRGYQRIEIRKHVDNIASYIKSEGSLIPNSIIICLNSKTIVKVLDDGIFELIIPENEKPGVIVDGQQRVVALKLSGRDDFYFSVSVFISDDVDFERQQFLLINSAKPLSRSLIYELLPHASGVFNEDLTRKKLPSLITQTLNYDDDSPLKGLIKLTTNPEGVIADNSMIKMLDNSLKDGALYEFCDRSLEIVEHESYKCLIDVLSFYYCAMREAFHEDWGRKPKDSRLFHGVGIISMGQLFDEIYYSYRIKERDESFFEYSVGKLHMIKPYCRWSFGYWDFGYDVDGEPILRKWNQLQNLSNDISMVTKYLLKTYDYLERGGSIAKSK